MIVRTIAAAALYFGLIFALGFVLGALRTLALAAAPDISRLQAVLVDAPVMLVASWFASAFVIRLCSMRATVAARAGIGGGAFLLLMLAELMIAVGLSGLTPAEHFRSYGEASHAVGLSAQVVFGLIPLMQIRRR
jgi:hypothetical protein